MKFDCSSNINFFIRKNAKSGKKIGPVCDLWISMIFYASLVHSSFSKHRFDLNIVINNDIMKIITSEHILKITHQWSIIFDIGVIEKCCHPVTNSHGLGRCNVPFGISGD